jgi:DNA gyrase subunit A
LAIALANIDPVIEMIKASPSAAEAKEKLLAEKWDATAVLPMLERAGEQACRPEDLAPMYGMHDGNYHLSPVQAQAILDLRLHRLTGLEHEKLIGEYKERLEEIAEYLHILADPDRLMEVIREELTQIKNDFGDQRRTEIIESTMDLNDEDFISVEDRVVTISHQGYAKTQPLADYQAQRRGGMGKSATAVKDEDRIEHLLVASTHDTILCFTNEGKVYWLRVFNIPLAGRQSRGRPIVNLLPLSEGERITSILRVNEYLEDHFVFMATANGTVKKTSLTDFSRPRSVGLRAVELDEGDHLVGTAITNGSDDVMLFASNGKVIRFNEGDVRAMGRTARGVRGIRLAGDCKVISLIIPQEGSQVLVASENGYGKRTAIEDFPVYGRGGQGVIGIQASDRNGQIVGAVQVTENEEMMLISNQGTLVRSKVSEVSILGRNTQGVRLIRLRNEELLTGLERVDEPEEIEFDELLDESSDAPAVDAPPADSTDNQE